MSINRPLLPEHAAVWRAALQALIAAAPCSTLDLICILKDESNRVTSYRDLSQTSPSEAKLIDRLLLLSASRLISQAQATDSYGFSHHARVLGELQPAHHSANSSFASPQAQTAPAASAPGVAVQDQTTPAFQPLPPSATTPEPTHLSVPQALQL